MATSKPSVWLQDPDLYPRVLEDFRAFKSKIVALKSSDESSAFLLTGTEGAVGTSTACVNLCMTLALDMPDKSILLVDANLDSPSIEDRGNQGLLGLLQEGGDMEDVLQPSPSQNLYVIAAGQKGVGSGMPFSVDAFSAFLEKAKKRFDYVLMDSAPILRSSLTRMLAPRVDAVVLVVEANRTRSEVVSAAQVNLRDEGANLVGCFLNRRRFVIPRWLYRFI
jgi:Mrp family chromosome partitioning ATPase